MTCILEKRKLRHRELKLPKIVVHNIRDSGQTGTHVHCRWECKMEQLPWNTVW